MVCADSVAVECQHVALRGAGSAQYLQYLVAPRTQRPKETWM